VTEWHLIYRMFTNGCIWEAFLMHSWKIVPVTPSFE